MLGAHDPKLCHGTNTVRISFLPVQLYKTDISGEQVAFFYAEVWKASFHSIASSSPRPLNFSVSGLQKEKEHGEVLEAPALQVVHVPSLHQLVAGCRYV